MSFDIDLKTLIAVGTFAFSVWLFLRRYRDEARKARVVELQKKTLEQLFRFRTSLVTCLGRIEDAPDVHDDNTASSFYAELRLVRREVRNAIDEFLLFSTREEYELLRDSFRQADAQFEKLADDLRARRINYKAANLFKRSIYYLLRDIEIQILRVQELAGQDRNAEITAVTTRFGGLIASIDAIVAEPSAWVPVEKPDGVAQPGASPLNGVGT